jgi:hypothetical protein
MALSITLSAASALVLRATLVAVTDDMSKLPQRQRDLVGCGTVQAHLEHHRGGRLSDQRHTVELRGVLNARDLRGQQRKLRMQQAAIAVRQRAVGGLHGELAQTAEDPMHLPECTFRGLRERDAVCGVALRNRIGADLALHAFAHGEAGSVVCGGVDAQTARQAIEARE